MGKKICLGGLKWDNLIGDCLQPSTKPPLLAVVDQVRDPAPGPQADSGPALSPAVWVFVMLATVGSILVLALWFIIYRRTRSSRTPDAEPGQEPPQKTDPPAPGPQLPSEGPGLTEMFHRDAEASAPALICTWGPKPTPCGMRAALHVGALQSMMGKRRTEG